MSDHESSPDPLPPGIEVDGELHVPGLGTAAWITDVGHLRTRNEDRLLVKTVWSGAYVLLLVADGAGGHDSGDKAAEMVVQCMHEAFPEEGTVPSGDPAAYIRKAILDTHAQVRDLASGQARPPASTVVGVLLEKASLAGWRFHVGDSRLYVRSSEGVVAQWTRDHNITNGLIDRGLPVNQAMKIADGGRLTQILGGGSHPEPEIHGPLAFEPGQSVLICSDGVYGHNGDRDVLLPAMNPEQPLQGRIQKLKADVLAGDAPDNLTAILWLMDEDAEVVAPRDTVTNSTKALSIDDIERRLAEKVRADLGLDDDDGDERAASMLPREAWIAGAFVLALLVFGGVRACGGGEEPREPVAATPAPAPVSPEVQGLLDTMDAAWLQGLPPEQLGVLKQRIATLVRVRDLQWMSLWWAGEVGGPLEAVAQQGWPAPGGDNGRLTADAWQARMATVNSIPGATEQPGLGELMQEAACARVLTGWPGQGSGLKLASWVAACLPPESAVGQIKVRLGGYPDRGWTPAELDAMEQLARQEDPVASVRSTEDPSPRLVEIAELAEALGDPRLIGLDVTVVVTLPTADVPPALQEAERQALAEAHAGFVAAVLRQGSAEGVHVVSAGEVADDLTELAAFESGSAEAARLADLNRRVEIWFSRPGEMDHEPEMPGEPEPAGEGPGAQPAAAVAGADAQGSAPAEGSGADESGDPEAAIPPAAAAEPSSPTPSPAPSAAPVPSVAPQPASGAASSGAGESGWPEPEPGPSPAPSPEP